MARPVESTKAQGRERGSALLIVLVFAAIIAITLYRELPVAAFEAKREKEQLLIDCGNEYAHGIKLYVRKVGQYPPSFEALENTNRMRFLRRRFKDPLTGKDDWRLLHAGPGGIIIDSKVNPVKNLPGAANGISNQSNITGSAPGNTGFTNTTSAANTGFGNTTGSNGQNSGFGGFSSGNSGTSGFGGFSSPANSGNSDGSESNVAPVPQRPPAIAANGAPGQAPVGDSGSASSSPDPMAALMSSNGTSSNGNATSSNGANVSVSGVQNNTGVQGGPAVQAAQQASPGDTANQSANGARPAGQFGSQTPAFGPSGAPPFGQGGNQSQTFNQNGAFGGPNQRGGFGNSGFGSSSTTAASSPSGLGVVQSGGIAGVASKAGGTSIKTVNDQSKYSLWEFYYDATKEANRAIANATNQMMNGAVAPTGTNPNGFSSNNNGFSNGNGGFSNNSNGSSNGNSGFSNGNTGFSNGNTGFSNGNSGFSNSTGFSNSNSSSTFSNMGTGLSGMQQSGGASSPANNSSGTVNNPSTSPWTQKPQQQP